MYYQNISSFLENGKAALSKGPVAIIMIEDDCEIASTLRHHQRLGFKNIIALMPDAFRLTPDLQETIHRIAYDVTAPGRMQDAINSIIAAAPEIWFYYGYNAEYLFFPFCETRSVGEMLAFHTEERRDAMLTYVIDLYSNDLQQHPDAVSIENSYMDRTGYYALARPDHNKHPKERQLDFYGGLRWRFEEHIPPTRRKIDRIALFKAKQGLKLRPDDTFDDEEYNTYSCKWHHNLTAAVCSFRTAKALKSNPGSTSEISNFTWHNSIRFEWHSRQLLDLGLMEPGQWF